MMCIRNKKNIDSKRVQGRYNENLEFTHDQVYGQNMVTVVSE